MGAKGNCTPKRSTMTANLGMMDQPILLKLSFAAGMTPAPASNNQGQDPRQQTPKRVLAPSRKA
eukprot:9473859-Pyramimonas_sp.AAC.2